ncbi:MAG: methyltransferase domain-containing protein [Rhodobacteraceae bacterium]|nr:methyltransferase domain-containing protein [Paracoccaceae bacterium]
MELRAVEASYARWAPVYDRTFGAVTRSGRATAVAWINRRGGRVLEVGVGTGLALAHYRRDCAVTGIDASAEMLARARARVLRDDLAQVRDLRLMDARQLDFADDSFDSVAAMHVISVVPEPERVMAEMARVCRPGGEVVIVGHYRRERGMLSVLERAFAPLAEVIGWHSDFDRARILGEADLRLVAERTLPPFGIMTLSVFRKRQA